MTKFTWLSLAGNPGQVDRLTDTHKHKYTHGLAQRGELAKIGKKVGKTTSVKEFIDMKWVTSAFIKLSTCVPGV